MVDNLSSNKAIMYIIFVLYTKYAYFVAYFVWIGIINIILLYSSIDICFYISIELKYSKYIIEDILY